MSFDLFKEMSAPVSATWRDPKECTKDAFWHRSFFDGLRAQAQAKFFVDEAPGKITVTPGEFILTLENASEAVTKATQREADWLSYAVQYGIPAEALAERYAKAPVPAAKSPTDWAMLILGWTLERATQYCMNDLVFQSSQPLPQPFTPAPKAVPATRPTLAEITGRIQASQIIPFSEARTSIGKKNPPPKLPQPTPDNHSTF